MASVSAPATSSSERAFFTAMAAAMALVVFAGFARTYYLRPLFPLSQPPAPLTPLIHVHGAVFSAWMILLVVQARLVAGRNVALHRRLGLTSIPLAILLVVVGSVTALHAVLRGVAPPGTDARQFLIVPLFALLVFAVLQTSALLCRRHPQAHKRLILLATIGLLPPALARWIVFYLGLRSAGRTGVDDAICGADSRVGLLHAWSTASGDVVGRTLSGDVNSDSPWNCLHRRMARRSGSRRGARAIVRSRCHGRRFALDAKRQSARRAWAAGCRTT